MIHTVLFILLFLPVNLMAGHSLSQYASEMEIKYQLPKDLLVNICTVESNWRNVKGLHGELGVCQLRPSSVKHAFPDLTRTSTSYYKIGDKGVGRIQYKLSLLGVPTKVTDVYDLQTIVSVRAFQNEHKLVVDGIVGPKTWDKLMGTPFPKATLEDKLWNPKDNIEIAAMYIARLSRILDTTDPSILAVAYNGGEKSWPVKYLKKLEKLNRGIQ